MSKNKKARITLEFAIGIVLSILILIAVVNIVGGLFRLNDSSKQSFNKLVSLIKDVNKRSPPGTVKTTALRMDKETFIVGFAKEDESFSYTILVPGAQITKGDKELIKLNFKGCKKGESCICLCRDLEDKNLDGKHNLFGKDIMGKITCEEDSLFCESFGNVNFTESFVISRHSKLQPITNPLSNPQFRTVFVEKYKGTSGKIVAVCENPIKGSCVSEGYKEQIEAIEGLKELAKFIESCKDREFVEDNKPCGCGAFDFKSEIPDNYFVEFIESDEKKLKLILKHKDKKNEAIKSIEVNIPLCIFQPILKGSDYLPKDERVVLEYNLPFSFIYYYKDDGDARIAFVKNLNENICILRSSERGYIGLDIESLDTITFESTIYIERNIEFGHPEINITGCKHSEEAK